MSGVVFAAVTIASGCAVHRKDNHDDIESLAIRLHQNTEASKRLFIGKSKIEILSAAQRVLQLLDRPDMRFDLADDEMMATRFSTYYAVFSFGFGRDWYSYKVTQKSTSEVIGQFGLYGEMLDGLPSPIPISFKSQIPVGAHTNPLDLNLFHDRVEYMLGIRDKWPECPLSNQRQKMMLCDNIGIEDRPPSQ